MTEASSQIATSRTVTDVFEQILGAIHRGELRPGQLISDGRLAEEFGVSRTPVREALVRLRELGIVEASASRFTRIAVITPRQLVQALIVWVALYGAVLDEVIPNASEGLLHELELRRSEAEQARRHRVADYAATADHRFYSALVERSSNPELRRSITGTAHIVRLGAAILGELLHPAVLDRTQQELVAAAREHDAAAARAALVPLATIPLPNM